MRPGAPRVSFVLGLALSVIGSLALLATLGGLPLLGDLWPLAPLAAGIVLVARHYAKTPRPKARYLFLGFVLGLNALLILAANLFWPESSGPWLARLWPLFVTLTVASVFPAALTLEYRKRINLLIPAWVLLALSVVILVFSLEWVDVPLTVFVSRWWPLVLLILGGSLMLASWLQRTNQRGAS